MQLISLFLQTKGGKIRGNTRVHAIYFNFC